MGQSSKLRALRVTSPLVALFAAGLALSTGGCEGQSAGKEQLEGDLKTTIITNLETGASGVEYFLEVRGGDWVRLHFDHEPALLGEVARVRVTGSRRDAGQFLVDSLDVLNVEVRRDAVAAITPVVRKAAVIMANFQNDPRQTRTEADVRAIVFTATTSANAYFKEQSYGLRSVTGKVRTDGDVYGWYTIAHDNTTCDYSAWGSAARAAAQSAGVDLTGYDHIIHYFSPVDCGWGGVGQVPGRYTWLNNSGSSTTAHELGHNFGLHHASTWSCTNASGQRVSISGTCTLNEYGDPFDVMGRGYRHHSVFQKGRLGWFAPSNMATATATGTFNLVPQETPSSALQSLRVRRDSTTFYYVEYRQPFGFDSFNAGDSVVNGVLIHVAPDYATLDRPKLLDMTTGSTSYTDAALLVGQTFSDPTSGVSIRLDSRSTAGATVTVTVPGSGTGAGGTTGAGGRGGTTGVGGGGGGGTGGGGGGGGTVVIGTGLKGDYFDNIDFTSPRLTRTDPSINFNWGSGSPDASLASDTFSVRWTGFLQPEFGQTYTFYTQSDDGIRLWVNGQQIINNWTDHGPTENSGTITLTAGQRYAVALEYYERGGGAVASLSWSSASQPKQIIPVSRLFPN
jgi:hypothetical protein